MHGLQDTTSSHHVRLCACLTAQFDFFSRADSGINLLAEDVRSTSRPRISSVLKQLRSLELLQQLTTRNGFFNNCRKNGNAFAVTTSTRARMRTHISARDVPRDKPRTYAMFMNASLRYICRVLTLCCFNSHCLADTKQFAFMGVFVTTDGAPALSNSRSRNYQAVFGMDDDFQQSVRRYALNEQGDIQDFRLRVTRLAQSLEPGSNVTACANGMEFLTSTSTTSPNNPATRT
jgi:hypothetical protein